MTRYKLLLGLILLLVIQQVNLKAQHQVDKLDSNVVKLEISFEANDFMPKIYGEIPSVNILLNTVVTGTDFYSENQKSKDIQTGFCCSTAKTKHKFTIAKALSFSRYSTIQIPIFIHVSSFLL